MFHHNTRISFKLSRLPLWTCDTWCLFDLTIVCRGFSCLCVTLYSCYSCLLPIWWIKDEYIYVFVYNSYDIAWGSTVKANYLRIGAGHRHDSPTRFCRILDEFQGFVSGAELFKSCRLVVGALDGSSVTPACCVRRAVEPSRAAIIEKDASFGWEADSTISHGSGELSGRDGREVRRDRVNPWRAEARRCSPLDGRTCCHQCAAHRVVQPSGID